MRDPGGSATLFVFFWKLDAMSPAPPHVRGVSFWCNLLAAERACAFVSMNCEEVVAVVLLQEQMDILCNKQLALPDGTGATQTRT